MKHLLKISDLTKEEFDKILNLAAELKAGPKNTDILKGKSMGMIFAKSSTRTRVSFEVGMYQLGGQALCLNAGDIQLGRGETIADTASTLSRYLDGIMIRTFKQSDVEGLAQYGQIPIINGLTDEHHPCQALADLLTIKEHKGGFEGVKVAYVGDGNNVAVSLAEACDLAGAQIAVAAPVGYEGGVATTNDPEEAVSGADVIYTDTWTSMGQEGEKEERFKIFAPYQVNSKLMSLAKRDCIFMHCLPAYRGLEMTEDIIDGSQSVVFDQAENRLHAQKAVMAILMGGV